MDETLPQPQVPVPPIEQPIPKKSFPLKWIIIMALLAGIVLAGIYLIFKSQSVFFPSQSNKVVNINETIKIGEYKILAKDGWEELEYLNTREAKNTDDVYAVFSQLYSSYVDKKGEMYVKDIVVKGDTAEVYFGGDESWLTDRMGSTGPYNYSGLVTFALTEDPGIKKVDFKLQFAGTHFGPGIRAREDYIDLWPQELLQFRKTADWKTYTNTGLGFSLKYSSQTKIIEGGKYSVDGVFAKNPNMTSFDVNVSDQESKESGFGNMQLSISVEENKNGRTLESLRQEFNGQNSDEDIEGNKIQSFLLDGKPAIRGAAGGLRGSYIILSIYKGRIYRLAFEPNVNKTGEQILSTFKFTETTSSPTPASEGAFCGGIANIRCSIGYTCKLDGSYPDAGGKCVKE